MLLSRSARVALIVILLLMVPSSVGALTINLIYAPPGSLLSNFASIPSSQDPNAVLLMEHAREAADDWEEIIEDVHTMNLVVYYANTAHVGTTTASMDIFSRDATDRRTVNGRIAVNHNIDAFYDPTPGDDSEFGTFEQMLISDMNDADKLDAFRLSAAENPRIEIKHEASASLGNKWDLLTIMRHEFGHLVGMNLVTSSDRADGDYDISPSLIGGEALDVVGLGHFVAAGPLMSAASQRDARRDITATDVIAAATASQWTQLNLSRLDYLGPASSNTTFHHGSNWIGGRAPDASDQVHIRNGNTVTVTNSAEVAELEINDGSVVNLISGTPQSDTLLRVVKELTLGKAASTPTLGKLYVPALAETSALSVELNAGEIQLAGGLLTARLGGVVNHDLVRGWGAINVTTTFDNQGELRPESGTLTIRGPLAANPTVNLDGNSTSSVVDASNGNLELLLPIEPAYRGTMTVGAGHFIDIPNAWDTTPSSTVTLDGSASQEAQLRSGQLTVRGDLIVDRLARVSNDLIVNGSNAEVSVPDANDELTINEKLTLVNNARISGDGKIIVGDDFTNNGGRMLVADLELHNDVLLQAGTVRVDNITSTSAPVDQSGGTLEFEKLTGDLIHSAGTWTIDRSLVTGNVDVSKHGHLEFSITDGSIHSNLEVDGIATLAGELNVEITGSYLPMGGEIFEIVTALSLNVSDITLVGPDAHRFVPMWNNTQLVLEALTPNFGDFNEDGIVNLADYTVWRDNLGSTTLLPNDPTPGLVDASDYTVWKNNFGDTGPASISGNLTAIPEPACWLLMSLGLLACKVHRLAR